MATGYTAIIEDGATFEQFVWRCARGMGALIMMRDDSLDAKIADEPEPDRERRDKEIAQHEGRLVELRAMTDEQARVTAAAEHEAACARIAEWNEKRAALAVKYRAMREKVAAWPLPTPDHANFKRFMLEQIGSSLQHDCDPWDPPSGAKSPAEWLRAAIANEERMLASSKGYRDNEQARWAERTTWVKALRESVPLPAKLSP